MLETIKNRNLCPTLITRLLYIGSTIICYAIGLTVKLN